MPISPNIALLYPRLGKLSEAALEARVDSATQWLKTMLGRDLDAGEKTETLSGRNRPVLWLKNTPVTEVTSVTVNGRVLASSDWFVTVDGALTRRQRGFVSQMIGWEPGSGNIVVVYESSGIPDIAVDDMVGAVANWMIDASTVSGVVASERIGNYQWSANAGMAGQVPQSVLAKIAPYRRVVS